MAASVGANLTVGYTSHSVLQNGALAGAIVGASLFFEILSKKVDSSRLLVLGIFAIGLLGVAALTATVMSQRTLGEGMSSLQQNH